MVNDTGSWRVLASRPEEQNSPWCAQLHAAGFAVLPLPLLAIEPLTGEAEQQRIKQCILDFDQYHAVVFVSQNAVEHTWRWLDRYWPQMPVGLRLYAIGEQTAACVRGHMDGEIAAARQAMNSEELLAHPDLQDVAGRKILICRGQGGRTTLAETLSGRGAKVSHCELYRRALPPSAATALAAETFAPDRDLLTVFSGETLDNLLLASGQAGHNLRPLPLLVPGDRVAAQARAAGFQTVIPARNATSKAMLDALIHYARSQG